MDKSRGKKKKENQEPNFDLLVAMLKSQLILHMARDEAPCATTSNTKMHIFFSQRRQ